MIDTLWKFRVSITRLGRMPFATLAAYQTASLPVTSQELRPAEAFHYTSGRWLYNERKRLEERRLTFNMPALREAAAMSIGQQSTDVHSFRKLAEGGFNRIFVLTMKDDTRVVARLPYPSTQPKHLAIASEVATMDFLGNHGLPVPKIHGYSIDPRNTVGAEYVLMDLAQGKPLGDVWFRLSDRERAKMLSQIAVIESKLFGIDLPAHGSVYYENDLPIGMGRAPIIATGSETPFCVGPDVSLKYWFEEREAMSFERAHCTTAMEVMENVARKELAWLRAHGRPRLPFDRVHRDITNYKPPDPEEHLETLLAYLRVTRHLVPNESWLHKPTIRHPDLTPNNIIVNDQLEIVSVIDRQHCTVLPLFLQAGIPAFFQNYGDPESDTLAKPELPDEMEGLDEEEREQELELYQRRHTHFYYMGATSSKNKPHFKALMEDAGLLRRKLYQHADEPWEGNNIPLKADLAILTQHWEDLFPKVEPNGNDCPCPISFTDAEMSEILDGITKQEQADRQMEILRGIIGIGADGWVSNEGFEDAARKAAEMRVEALKCANTALERELTIRHWPFDDHDEKE